ncbi:MAG: hypothetical protein M1829_004300 [Trizodia sp. TS-e1964]|nr:MAG: hypothetical protein M1829_004300 [Trizodia sp. TS-e1964]
MANGVASSSYNSSKSNGKFQLPTLPNLDSLTAGTDIPPPLDSPIEETPPSAPPLKEHLTIDPSKELPKLSGDDQGLKSPLSPTPSTRPNSVRRFLSIRSTSNTYHAPSGAPGSPKLRPLSPSAASATSATNPGLSKKRSGSSWFSRRKRLDDDSVAESGAPAPAGPPPPTLPELKKLGKEGLGDELDGEDMFRDIK